LALRFIEYSSKYYQVASLIGFGCLEKIETSYLKSWGFVWLMKASLSFLVAETWQCRLKSKIMHNSVEVLS
jgi:hypothetical protein